MILRMPQRFEKICALCVLLALVSQPISALETDGWLRLETQHFTFLTNGPEGVARSTAHDLEQLRYAITQLWPEGRFEPAVPTLIYIFEDNESFGPYRLRRALGPTGDEPRVLSQGSGSAGYLVPHEHGTYAALMIDSESRPVRFVYKQYVHQLLHAKLPTLPLWLRHGFAEYYSTFEVDGDEALIGLPIKAHLDVLSSHLAGGKLGLMAMVLEAERTRDVGQPSMYPQSWALTHYLSSDPDRARQLGAFAYHVARDMPAEKAFAKSFDVDFAELEKRLVAYLKGGKFQYLRAELALGAHPARVTRLAPHEAVFHLGDLVAHTQPARQEDAAAHFRSALQLAPGHGRSLAGLGFIAEQAGDDAAASTYYQQAIAQDADHFLVQYLYGSSLAQSFGDRRPTNEDEQARLNLAVAALERSVEQWGNFAPAWARLGYARNLQPEASHQAVEALENAHGLLPGRLDIAFNLLLAYARIDNREAAEAIVARMALLAADDAALARAREVLLTMDYRDAARLVRQDQLDDATLLFARILAQTTNPALQQQVEEQLGKLESTAHALHFSELYRKVTNLLADRQLTAAADALKELDAIAQPGQQRAEVERLTKKLAAMRKWQSPPRQSG